MFATLLFYRLMHFLWAFQVTLIKWASENFDLEFILIYFLRILLSFDLAIISPVTMNFDLSSITHFDLELNWTNFFPAGTEASNAAIPTEVGERPRFNQLPTRVHRRASSPDTGWRPHDRQNRSIGVWGLRIRQPITDDVWRLCLTQL